MFNSKKNRETKQFIIIGIGRFGRSMARTLTALGHNVLAVDQVKEIIDHIANEVTHAVQVDAMDEDALIALGVRNMDIAVVAIGEDVQASILVSVMLKELGVKYVVAKARNHIHGRVLERTGVDRVIYPERDMAVRVAHSLVASNTIDLMELSPEISIAEIDSPKEFHNRTLGEINFRALYGVSVIAIKNKEIIVANPGAQDQIEAGSILVVVGTNNDIAKLPS